MFTHSYLASAAETRKRMIKPPSAPKSNAAAQRGLAVTAQPGLATALARSAASQFSDSITRAAEGRNFADILSDLYTQTDRLLAEISTSSEPALKRAEALKSIAKILPLLQQAERNARTRIKGKALEDLTDDELARLASRLPRRDRARKNKIARDFPSQSDRAAVPTHSVSEEAESDIAPLTTSEEGEPDAGEP